MDMQGPRVSGKGGCMKGVAALGPNHLSCPSSPAFPSAWLGHPPASSAVLLAHHAIPARKKGGNMSRTFSHCILPPCPPSRQEGKREGAGDREGQTQGELPGSGGLLDT